MPELKKMSLNDLEVEIVREIRKWRDQLITDDGGESTIAEIDAGDAAKLAADIVSNVLDYSGVEIIGELKAERKLSDGWGD